MKVLDCTLRDGAHINKGLFGKEGIFSIIQGLADSQIEFVEMGFLENCKYNPNSCFFNEVSEAEGIIGRLNKKNTKIGLMLRTDRFDYCKLTEVKYVDFVRIAFYKEHLEEVIKYSERLREIGVSIHLNPIAVTSYSTKDIFSLLKTINNIKPHVVSIVDTFGALRQRKARELVLEFDQGLGDNIALGMHLHENLSLSLCLSSEFSEYVTNREKIIDSSIFGMGRVPGNLPTELFANYMNQQHMKGYNIGKIMDIGELYIDKFKMDYGWGYDPIYMHSAILNIDRTYPELFHEMGLSYFQNIRLQNMIKKLGFGNRFNKDKACEIASKFKF